MVVCFFALKILVSGAYLLYVGSLWDLNSWFIIGVDERRYFDFSAALWQAIQDKGLIHAIANYHDYTKSQHFLYYFLIAPFFQLEFPLFAIVMVKAALFGLSANYIYKISEFWHGELVARLSIAAFFLYFPMQLLSLSYMRDDLIFFFCVGIFYHGIFEEKSSSRVFVLFSYLVLLSLLRIHAALAALVFLAVYNFKSILGALGFRHFLVFLVFSGFFFFWRLDFTARALEQLPLYDLIFKFPYEMVRLVLSPNPFSISQDYQGLGLHLWYAISLPVSVLGAILFVLVIVEKRIGKVALSVLAFTFVYLAPYVALGHLGFRQQSIVAPLLFVFVSLSYFSRRRSCFES